MTIKFLLSIILIALSIFLFVKYVKAYKVYSSDLDKLFGFLSEKADDDALKSLGAINPFGKKEKWHVPSRKIREYLDSREDLKKDAEVKKFMERLDVFEGAFMGYYILPIVLVFIVCFLYTSS